jgi:diadenylate cyclase
MIVVALPIVFQPELRRALEQLGRGKIFTKPIPFLGTEDVSRLINELVRTAQVLSGKKHGALIVIERTTGLNDYIETGIKIDAIASIELMVNVFVPSTPLHDGAIIIRGDRIAAAGCFLPLTDSPYLSKQLGTRHRAALGVTENSDSIAVIISEETGTISVANDGELTRYLEEENLKEMLEELLIVKNNSNYFSWFSKKK